MTDIDNVPLPAKPAVDISKLQPGDIFIIRGSRYTFVRFNPAVAGGLSQIVGTDRRGGCWVFGVNPLGGYNSVERIIAKAAYKPRKRSTYPLNMKDPFVGIQLARSERNDCTVRALAIAAEIPYEQAYEMMATQCGRKKNKGSNLSRLTKSIDDTAIVGNYRIKWNGLKSDYSGQRKKGTTVRQLLTDGTLPARAILRIAGHVFAVINGVAYDTFHAGARSVVSGYYSFEPVWATGPDAVK